MHYEWRTASGNTQFPLVKRCYLKAPQTDFWLAFLDFVTILLWEGPPYVKHRLS